MTEFEKNIEQYIFKPSQRGDTDDHIPTNSRADYARSVVMSAERIKFVCPPTVGERAVFTTESNEYGTITISTSTVRECLFDEEKGSITIKTRNSVYVFEVDSVA